MGAWPAARQRYAALAGLAATSTWALLVTLDPAWSLFGPSIYLLLTVGALFLPAAIAVQVVVGQLLLAGLLLSTTGPEPLLLMPVMGGVVASAELLAVVARLDSPLERDPAGAPSRVAGAAVLGAGIFGAVLLMGWIPGPTGLLALALAAGTLALLAGWMLKRIG